MEEGLKGRIVAMQKSAIPVTRYIVLIKGGQIFLDAFEMKTRSMKGLDHGRIQIFAEKYPLLVMRTSHNINRVRSEASIDCI